jgi:uncharacterized membrane-anchored protein YitT (DUF2179 family)
MENTKQKCEKCESENYSIQREISKIKENKGCLHFLVMNILFGIFYYCYLGIKWTLMFIFWLFILLPIRLIQKQPLINPKKPQISHETVAVCQNCGHSWKMGLNQKISPDIIK